MVKTFLAFGFVLLALSIATISYYSSNSFTSVCKHRILTSNSFHTGVGESFKAKYKKKFNCELNFAVVNGANLITNLFNKQPKQYDILLGLDEYQINKIIKALLSQHKHQNVLSLQNSNIFKLQSENKLFWAYDESPLTFFMRDIEQSEFNDLNHLILYLAANKLSVAVPLKTTSVLGALFEDWVSLTAADKDLILKSESLKFVKSWSEAFGLFERKIVDGFLSFETSEIYFLKAKNISKISIATGHPNLKEYFAFSSTSKMSNEQKDNFLNFIYSEDIQTMILNKNYMWPTNLSSHENSNLRTLKVIDMNAVDIK